MDGVKIGSIIKEARERQGITQEDLCGLAITPTTLSRIENGRVLPSRKNREYLCQKLGILEYLIPYEPNKNDEEKFSLEKQILKKIALHEYDYSDLLDNYEKIMSEDSPLDCQFFLYATAIKFDKETKNFQETKKRLIEALSLTFPKFEINMDLTTHYFSSLEITLINCITLRLYHENKNEALMLMRRLRVYCEKNINNVDMIINNYISILFNLQNWEGFEGNWKEAYKIADEGIKICIDNGNTYFLPDFFIDKGWNAIQLGKKEEARKCILEGYALLKARGAEDVIDSVFDEINEHLGELFKITKNDF